MRVRIDQYVSKKKMMALLRGWKINLNTYQEVCGMYPEHIILRIMISCESPIVHNGSYILFA